jgi:hypothetical protein
MLGPLNHNNGSTKRTISSDLIQDIDPRFTATTVLEGRTV